VAKNEILCLNLSALLQEVTCPPTDIATYQVS